MSEAEKVKRAPKKETNLEIVDVEKFQAAQDQRLSVLKTYKIYIDGQFPRTESGRYYALKDAEGNTTANVCLSSRKDFRNAVVAARKAFHGWSEKSAFNRSQILYRIAEILEGRREQFVSELILCGVTKRDAEKEVNQSIDRLVYYAGWADKYQQVFSSVNPVSSAHFNFSMLEPVGVVSIVAPEETGLLGLVSVIAPVIVGGNTCVVLASKQLPLAAVTFTEVLATSDVPAGVINLLTGDRRELLSHMTSHMDVNAIFFCGAEPADRKTVQTNASLNVKRVFIPDYADWSDPKCENPYLITEFQETKTTWHPIGI